MNIEFYEMMASPTTIFDKEGYREAIRKLVTYIKENPVPAKKEVVCPKCHYDYSVNIEYNDALYNTTYAVELRQCLECGTYFKVYLEVVHVVGLAEVYE